MTQTRDAALLLARAAWAVDAKLLHGPGPPRRLRKRAMDHYRARIQTAVRGFVVRVMRRPVHDSAVTEEDLAWFEAEMIALGEMFIPEAFGFGLGALPLGQEEDDLIGGLILSNTVFIRRSLIPDFRNHLEAIRRGAIDAGDRDFGRRILDGLRWFSARAELYTGGYWASIWNGLQRAIRVLFPADPGPPVRRLLEPTAEHCTTCPPKAREYASWSAMVAETGGLPGDGSDECRSHCRCRLQVYVEGVWLEVVTV